MADQQKPKEILMPKPNEDLLKQFQTITGPPAITKKKNGSPAKTETSKAEIQTSTQAQQPQAAQDPKGQAPVPTQIPAGSGPSPSPQIIDTMNSPDVQLQKLLKQLPGASPEGRGELLQQIINLVMQLGSSGNYLAAGSIDERKMAKINELEQVALGHFDYRGRIDGIRYFDNLVDWILTSSQGVDGLRARQIIDVSAAVSGQPKVEVAKEPNIIERTFWNRGWKSKAEQQGQVVVR